MKKWINHYRLPLLVGIALLILPFLYLASESIAFSPLDPRQHLIQNLLTYFLLLLFAYTNHTVLVPRWYLEKQYARYGVVTLTCLVGIVWLSHRVEQWAFLRPPKEPTLLGWAGQVFWKENLFAPMPYPGQSSPSWPLVLPNPPPGLPYGPLAPLPLGAKLAIFFLLGSVSTLASVSMQTANRLKQVESEKLLAELNQLKAQISPHFLFNTLNSIYALALRQDDRTAETIVKLSEFLRYTIRDAHQDKVALALETNYIRNYIDLQRARLRDSVTIDYTIVGPVDHQSIVPLLLISFIENAFKHGVNPDQESIIRIKLTVAGDQLNLRVFNRKVPISQLEPATGIGLSNARERLRLRYPNAHQLAIQDTPTDFTVDLRITLC